VTPHTPFAGFSEITLDDKGRLSIPSKFRAVVGSTPPPDASAAAVPSPAYYVLPWDDSLVIITEHRYRELSAIASAGTPVRPTMDPKAISPQRLFALSERVEPDGAGRVTLPKELAARMKLQGEMVIFSGGSYLQVMPALAARKLIDDLYAEES
jgi:DNA-binding transcriptional regulator/RsmH inhibitor MraZ